MNQCSGCNDTIQEITKTRELINSRREKVTIYGVPYTKCSCGDRINIRSAAMIELYAEQNNHDKNVSYAEIEDLFYEIPFMDLIDPNGNYAGFNEKLEENPSS